MNWLLLDTACPRAMVGIIRGSELLAASYLHETLKHGEKLASSIQDCLDQASLRIEELNGVAVGQGPGSFVGVRVAISHAKGLCMALEIPLMGICTLTALAASPELPLGEGMAFLDARRGEFYARRITRTMKNGCLNITPLAEPTILTKEEVKAFSLVELMGGFYLSSEQGQQHLSPGVSVEGMHFMLQQYFAAGSVEKYPGEVFSLAPAYVRDPDAKIRSHC